MKLFLGRHGEASFNAPSDRERELTQVGVQATQAVAKAHREELGTVKNVWSSELVRARQTAAIYAEELDVPISSRDYLAPDYEAEEVLEALAKEKIDGDLLIVSHQPLIGDLVSLLVRGNIFDGHPYVTSEIVVMEVDEWASACAEKLAEYRP